MTRRDRLSAAIAPPVRCPRETLELLRSLGDRVLWIRGNADRELDPSEQGIAPPDVDRAGCEQPADDGARSRSSTRLPEQVELEVDGRRHGPLLSRHASERHRGVHRR